MVSFFSKLNRLYPKHQFDPSNKKDLKAYKEYLATRSWGHNGCPFELEWPWLSVPDMINHKLAESAVEKVQLQLCFMVVSQSVSSPQRTFGSFLFSHKYCMASYSFTASSESQKTPVLQKGLISISTTVNIYFVVGEKPVAKSSGCALIRAGETLQLRLPVRCSSIAILAVSEPGTVTITEISGGASSSCSR